MSVQPLSAFAVTLKRSSPSIYSRASSAVSHHAVDCAAIAKRRTWAHLRHDNAVVLLDIQRHALLRGCGAADAGELLQRDELIVLLNSSLWE